MNNKKYHINNDIKNCNIQTFSFNHKVTEEELLTIEESLLTGESIKEIYFKEDIDIKSIGQIRSILESSKWVEDNNIEKYILIEYEMNQLNQILDINYLNPNTWKISYIRTDGAKEMYSITECRKIIEYFDTFITEINNKDLSPLEKICLIYDKVKLLDYKDKKNSLLEIIEHEYTNSYGYNLLFQELLNRISIKSYIEKVKSSDENRFISIIEINDNKYDINGVYLFDPYSDSLPKSEYDEAIIRRINYNYFCISIKQLNKTIYKESITGIFKQFLVPRKSMLTDRLDELNLLDKNEIKKLNNVFGSNYESLYEKLNNTKEIDETKLFDIINKTINSSRKQTINNINIIDIIKENFYLKKKEMYN